MVTTNGVEEIWAAITFIFVLMGLTGLYFFGTSAHKAYKLSGDSQQGFDQKTMLSQLIGCMIGIFMMAPVSFLTLSGNSVFDGGMHGHTIKELRKSIEKGEVPDLDELTKSLENEAVLLNSKKLDGTAKRYWTVIYMLIMFAGALSLYRGFKIWWISLTSGSDMGGTSAYMRGGTIFFHLFGGVAMLNITTTLAITQATFTKISGYILSAPPV